MSKSLFASPVILSKLNTNDDSIRNHHINRISPQNSTWPAVIRRGCYVSPLAAYQPRKPRDPPKAKAVQEQKWVHEGVITESLPNGMFRVRLDNEDLILGYVSGKIRQNFIRILPGDKVQIEVSRYDSTRGRIIFRK